MHPSYNLVPRVISPYNGIEEENTMLMMTRKRNEKITMAIKGQKDINFETESYRVSSEIK